MGIFSSFLDVFFPKTEVGVRCGLCGWEWRDDNVQDAYGIVDRVRGHEMFLMHVRDRHAHLLPPSEEP